MKKRQVFHLDQEYIDMATAAADKIGVPLQVYYRMKVMAGVNLDTVETTNKDIKNETVRPIEQY